MSSEVIIVGCGPAGLALATELARAGIAVELVDERADPGGQIYRNIENNSDDALLTAWLGEDYSKGASLVTDARSESRVHWRLRTAVWDVRSVDHGVELSLLHNGQISTRCASHVVLATGAMERPMPFPGWTLPGVMSIGAAQTLLKDAALLPADEFVLAGQGPLLNLFAEQLLAAGARPQAVLDFAPKWLRASAMRPLLQAAGGSWRYILKGLRMRRQMRCAGLVHVHDVDAIEAIGENKLARVRYRCRGTEREIVTRLLLTHDGVVPNTQMSMAAGCSHSWHSLQQCWAAELDDMGRSSVPGLWLLGDGARVLGADAAAMAGRIMAQNIAAELGHAASSDNNGELKNLSKLVRLRHFLDHQYAPRAVTGNLPDNTLLCRCENVQAGEVRALARSGCMGPNQLRVFSRAGMGPCMGRQCGTAISQLMAHETGRNIDHIGHFSARPPLKPVTLAELANYQEEQTND